MTQITGLNNDLPTVEADRETATVVAMPAPTRIDRLAIWMSGLCLVHCLAVPASLLTVPWLSQRLTDSQAGVHWALLLLALPISGWALWRGYRTHGRKHSALLGATGLVLMFLGVAHIAGHAWEVPLTVLGVSALIAAHVINIRLKRPHDHAH